MAAFLTFLFYFLLSVGVALSHGVPIDDIENGFQVSRALVLVLQVIGVFPHIDPQNRRAFHFSNIKQRVILVGCRSYLQFAGTINNKPSPPGTEPGSTCFLQFFLQLIKRTESLVDGGS